jgi:hypothetical protein
MDELSGFGCINSGSPDQIKRGAGTTTVTPSASFVNTYLNTIMKKRKW